MVDRITFPDDKIPTLKDSTGPLVWGFGPHPAKLMIIGEAPGEQEEHLRVPFVGMSGQYLNDALAEAGIERQEVYITNVVKRRPTTSQGATRTPTPTEVKHWAKLLWEEINLVRPEIVLLVGATALKAVWPDSRPITKVRGIVKEHTLGFKTLATYHPAFIFRNRARWTPISTSDFQLLARLMRGEKIEVQEKVHRVCSTIAAVEQLVVECFTKAESIAIDIETSSLDGRTGTLLCVAISPAPEVAYIVPIHGQDCKEMWEPEQKKQVLACLQEILNNSVPKIFHNGKFDTEFLALQGFSVSNWAYDTLIEHHLLSEQLPHDLKFIANYELGEPGHDEELHSYRKSSKDSFAVVPERVLWKYSAYDVDYTHRAHTLFMERLQEENPKVVGFYTSNLMPLARALKNLELRGIHVDTTWLGERTKKATEDAGVILSELSSEVGEGFNFNSPQQLGNLFYSKRGHKVESRTASGQPSTDKDALQVIAKTDPLAKKLLGYRKKLHVATWFNSIAEHITPEDGCVHTEYNITGTDTFRLSSSNPNMQNVEDNPEILGVFDAPKGYVFGKADFSQIELLVLASLAGETKMLEQYSQRTDLHRLIASTLLGVKPEEITKDVRSVIKSIVSFGIIYGRSAWALAADFEIQESEAKEIISLYSQMYPACWAWCEAQKKLAHQMGYVESPLGFRRHFELKNPSRGEIGHMERQAVNSPIQGSAACITNAAHVRFEEEYQQKKSPNIVCATLHDALYFYMPEDSWKDQVQYVREVMEKPIPWLNDVVPHVKIEVGYRWGDGTLYNEDK